MRKWHSLRPPQMARSRTRVGIGHVRTQSAALARCATTWPEGEQPGWPGMRTRARPGRLRTTGARARTVKGGWGQTFADPTQRQWLCHVEECLAGRLGRSASVLSVGHNRRRKEKG